MNAATVQSLFTDIITWRVVIERSGTPRLHSVRLRADMSIRAVMEEILALYQREQSLWSRWLSRHVVEIATFHTEADMNSENRNGQEVRITERNPSTLSRATHHMSADSFEAPVGADGSPSAILLKPRLTQVGLFILAMAVLLAIVVPGALLGVLVGQAGLGVALSGAITGILALVGKLCGWLV